MQAIVRGVATGLIFTEFVNVLDFVKGRENGPNFMVTAFVRIFPSRNN